MYEALYRWKPTNPVSYFVLSGINSADGTFAPPLPDAEELQCTHCHEPVHFYGREAARRHLLGMKKSDIYISPRFDHYDGMGKDCPRRSDRKPAKADSFFTELYADFSPCEILARGRSEEILFEPTLIKHVLGVWAHMFGSPNISFEKFEQARVVAQREGFLSLRGLEPWRTPYALAFPMGFPTNDGRDLRLVPRRLVNFSDSQRRRQFAQKREAEADGHKTIEPLYVVDAHTMDRFSGPHLPLRDKTAAYSHRNERWAATELNGSLNIA